MTLWRRLPSCSAAAGTSLSGLIYILDMSYFTLSLVDAAVMAYVGEVGWVRTDIAGLSPILSAFCVRSEAG